MKKIRCLVIDDEPLARKGLQEYIADMEALTCTGSAGSPSEALKYLPETDLMFLDINMPKVSGIEFLQQLKQPPLTIITTAYPQYALQGFELDVLDYLLKPVSFPRFLKAANKAIDYFRLLSVQDPNTGSGEKKNNDDYFFIKSNGVLEKVFLNEILAVEALANYVTIHCIARKLVVYLTLKQVRDHLQDLPFLQVHKSFIVALSHIEKIDHESLILGTLSVPIGASYREEVLRQITDGKILKR